MKKLLLLACIALSSTTALANSQVVEGVVQQADVITTSVGRDGRPVLSAAAGVAIGSTIGGGSGNDAAKVVGGLMGARRGAHKHKETVYGWRYVVKTGDHLQSVDVWCSSPNQQCAGIATGKDVYVIDGNKIALK